MEPPPRVPESADVVIIGMDQYSWKVCGFHGSCTGDSGSPVCVMLCHWLGFPDILKQCSVFVCETWSLTLREERRLRVFENRVLRRVFGPKRDEVTGEWRKLHNEELNDLYSLLNIVGVVKSRRMRWAGHVAHMGEDKGVHRVLVGKPEGNRPLGRPRRRWEDNINL